MMTLAQLRGLAIAAGILLGLLCFCFSYEGLIRFFWVPPLAVLSAILIALGTHRAPVARKRRSRMWGDL